MKQIYTYKNIRPEIDPSVFVAPGAWIVGKVKIGADSSIWFNTTLRGDVNEIVIGARTNIQDQSLIHVSSFGLGTYIGDDVTAGHACILHACKIGNGAFIGMQACIMDGAEIEDGAMVAAGALVPPNKRIPKGELWAGSPARKMRDLTEDDFKHMKWSAAHYAELAAEYRDNVIDS